MDMAFSLTPIVHTSEVFESKDEPSNVQPHDFHSVVLAGGLSLGRRQPSRAMAAPPATAMSAEIDRLLRASPHRYLPISWKEARHGRAGAIEITTADALEI
jgi:hypothetical protein